MDRRLTPILTTFLLVLATCCQAAELEEATERAPWQPNFGQGVWQVTGGFALVPIYALPADQQQLVVPAAAASAVLYHPEGGAHDGIAASPKHVEIFIDVAGAEKAEIAVWYRLCRTNAADDARFLQGVDASLGGNVGWVDVTTPAGEWTWLRAKPQPELRPHRHELRGSCKTSERRGSTPHLGGLL